MIALIAAVGASSRHSEPAPQGAGVEPASEASLVIGCNGRMPWHIPEDLHHFRNLTMGHTVVMGRRTFESIGRPLPNRRNIVLSHDYNRAQRHSERSEESQIMFANASPPEILRYARNDAKLFIIGGGTVYEQFMPLADRIYLTVVEGDWAGDTFFPAVDPAQWRITSREPHPDAPIPFEYRVYDRIRI